MAVRVCVIFFIFAKSFFTDVPLLYTDSPCDEIQLLGMNAYFCKESCGYGITMSRLKFSNSIDRFLYSLARL
jgi:hypothetical protein